MTLKPLSCSGLWLAVINHAAIGLQMKDREIQSRRVQHAHIRHREAGAYQPFLDDRVDAWRRQPAIAAEGKVTRARLTQMLCNGIAELAHEGIGKILVRDSADVVLAKNSWVHCCF